MNKDIKKLQNQVKIQYDQIADLQTQIYNIKNGLENLSMKSGRGSNSKILKRHRYRKIRKALYELSRYISINF